MRRGARPSAALAGRPHRRLPIFSQNPETEDAASTALAELATHPALPATWPALEALTAVIARRRAISLLRGRHAAKRGAGETLSLEQLEYEPAAAAVARPPSTSPPSSPKSIRCAAASSKNTSLTGGLPRRSARVCSSSPPPCAVTCSAPFKNSATASARPRPETILPRFATYLVCTTISTTFATWPGGPWKIPPMPRCAPRSRPP
jgi:hypothetical protein